MITVDTFADFTWLWNHEFFVETNEGNFIWNSPRYGGDGTIRPCTMTFEEYLKKLHIDCGRSKGKHRIGSYCGEGVKFV